MKKLGKQAGVLAGVYFFSQVLFAYQPEQGFWAQRRRAARDQRGAVLASVSGNGAVGPLSSQFPAAQSVTPSLSRALVRSVPAPFLKDHGDLLNALSIGHGSIRKISLPLKKTDRSPVVVHIQDVHMNQEAQWNIRETVHGLLRSGNVDLVGLEGATDEIDLQPFVDFPSRRAVAASADYVLKQNKITGPVHAAMTAEGKLPRFVGVDDPVHYPANVQAYRDAEPLLDLERNRVDERIRKLDQEKKEICSLELRAFDGVVRSFEDQKVSLGDYVLELAARSRSLPIDVGRFAKALALERTLDFQRVEKERADLINVLATRLNKTEASLLLAHSAAYRAGKIGYGVFYEHLQNLCRSKGVSLARFPAMDAYVRYVLSADGIDAERLFNELVGLEKSIYAALAITPKEKEWVGRCREVRLTKKLVNFSLTPADWKEYEPLAGQAEWAPFETFYKEAHIRDGSMADNLLKALEAGHGTTALLVTGGYHAEGIADRLTAQGVTVLSYVPKIDKVDTAQGSAYLSVFSQEKTPLEKLFAGEKLFLGHNPSGGVTEAAILTETIQGVGIPSVKDQSKFEGYLSRYYQGRRLTFGEHTQRPDGSWVADVTLYDGDKGNTFSVVYRNEGNGLTIQSFGWAEKEVRPPFGAVVEKFIGIHTKLAPLAGRVSIVTEFPLFLLIPWWTPAHFLWFARRHQASRPESVSLLLGWMAIHSLSRNPHSERAAVWEKIRTGMRLGLFQHPFWNGLGLFTLAADKSVGGDVHSGETRIIHRSDPAHPDFCELKIMGRPEAAVNGAREVTMKCLVQTGEKYLLLLKREKKAVGDRSPARLKYDVPGGGAAGQEAGVSLPKGSQREIKEELKLNVRFSRTQDIDGKKGWGFRFYSIPGPKGKIANRRPIIFRRVKLSKGKAKRIHTSDEHTGYRWATLPKILNSFGRLNTGPKIAFYLEFLREAYGITGVRSIRSLAQTHRLKSMTDPVYIETDSGSFIWCPNGDVNQHLPEGFSVERTMDRVASKKSLLWGWQNPRVFREEGGQTRSIGLVLWRLKNESRSVRTPEFAFSNGNGNGSAGTGNRSRARINYLASRIPPGVTALSSLRMLVKYGENYVFLVGDGHRNECPGGVGVTPEEIQGRVANQLGVSEDAIRSEDISVSESPLFTHQIGDGANFEFFQVTDGNIQLDPKSNIEGEGVVLKNYDELKQAYYDFTLSARMLIVKEIVEKEYGYIVSSIKPIRRSQEGGVSQISLTTDKGDFVFRKANTIVEDSRNAVKKSDGSNELYVNIGGTNFILTRPQSRSSLYEKVSTNLREQEAAVQRGVWIQHFRGIAQGIKNSEIWSDLINAQNEIASGNNPTEVSAKADNSPVTVWDYKLQLAFLDMIQKTGLPAHVVGEESPLNKDFLNTLSREDQDRVIDMVLKNAANVPDGLVFFVDPIDGTTSFKNGREEFAFTFGVLYKGKPLYAATYMPSKQILYEAVVNEKAIYKNGEKITSDGPAPYSLIKVQRGLQEQWKLKNPTEFPQVDFQIPTIALLAARMAAKEEGSPSEAVLNEQGISSWDWVPAAIFLTTAGFSVVDFHGKDIFEMVRRAIKEGTPPRTVRSQFLAAHPSVVKKFLKVVNRVCRQKTGGSNNAGTATSRWMLKLFEMVGAWVDKFSSQEIKDRQEKTFEKRFGIHYRRNAPRYEWGLAAVALVANLVWVNSVWMGVGFSALFVISHFKFFNLKTDVKVGPFRVLVMAVIYGALIALSPDSVFGLIQGTGVQSAVHFFMTIVIWHGTYELHRSFDSPKRSSEEQIQFALKPLSVLYWGAKHFSMPHYWARRLGWMERGGMFALLFLFRQVIDTPPSSGSGFFSLLGFEPVLGPLFLICLFYYFLANFLLMSLIEKRRPPFQHLVAPLTIFLLAIPGYVGFLFGAAIFVRISLLALWAQGPEPKRNLPPQDITNDTPADPVHKVAQKIGEALERKPLRMGVGELRERIYETAVKNVVLGAGLTIDLGDPSVAGDGVKFYLVDPVTLEKPGNGDRLKNVLSKNPDLIVVLAQPVDGLSGDQALVSEESFRKNGVGYDVIVSGLKNSILQAAGDRPFQIMTSPLLSLNTTNMAEDDPVRQASENAVVYVLELMRGFSASASKWSDVLNAFQALAEAA